MPKKAQRRRFSASSASYKLKVLEEAERDPSQVGALLRREALYSSHLSEWRKQRRKGALGALEQKRGPKGKSPEQVQIEQQQREIARLERELYRSRAIIDAQKKLAEILEPRASLKAEIHGYEHAPILNVYRLARAP